MSDFDLHARETIGIAQSLLGGEHDNWARDAIKHAQGMIGESAIRQWLVRERKKHAQIDLMCMWDDEWILMEIKHQERFINPDGHGLPTWQLNARLMFYEKTRVVPWLYVVEPHDQSVAYRASMVKLREIQNKGENKKDWLFSKTKKRIIFMMHAFEKINLSTSIHTNSVSTHEPKAEALQPTLFELPTTRKPYSEDF
jgi:hypothetical protein